MATGASFLVLMLWLSQDPGPGKALDEMDTQISAPPELLALIPDAAAATVAAGYFNTSSEAGLTVSTTGSSHGGSLTMTESNPSTSGSSTVEMMKPMKIVISTTEVGDGTSEVTEVSTAEVVEVSTTEASQSGGASASTSTSAGTQNALQVLENSLQFLGVSFEASSTTVPESSEAAAEVAPEPITSGNEFVGATTKPVGVPVQVVSIGSIKDSTGIIGTPIEVATMEVATESEPGPTMKEEVLLVGDGRYEWQEWSSWHCNCPAGSMSRVRDIAYNVPDVHLDPLQYNVLRFERKACDYEACNCSREAHQCDQVEVICNEKTAHLCALKDLEFDKHQKRTEFWSNVHSGLKNLWQNMKEAFPRSKVGD